LLPQGAGVARQPDDEYAEGSERAERRHPPAAVDGGAEPSPQPRLLLRGRVEPGDGRPEDPPAEQQHEHRGEQRQHGHQRAHRMPAAPTGPAR
jgi:hypothetical protein